VPRVGARLHNLLGTKMFSEKGFFWTQMNGGDPVAARGAGEG